MAFAYIAAGHVFDLSASIGDAENPDAGIGPVTVGGNWFHSSLSAGINDATSNGVESTDSKPISDALRIAVITSARIKGGMLDNPSVNGPSGIVAEKIGVVSASGVTLFKSGDLARSVDPLGRVDIAQI